MVCLDGPTLLAQPVPRNHTPMLCEGIARPPYRRTQGWQVFRLGCHHVAWPSRTCIQWLETSLPQARSFHTAAGPLGIFTRFPILARSSDRAHQSCLCCIIVVATGLRSGFQSHSKPLSAVFKVASKRIPRGFQAASKRLSCGFTVRLTNTV